MWILVRPVRIDFQYFGWVAWNLFYYHPPQPAKNIKKLCRIRGLDMGVSKNNGTPKSSILIGFSTINHPFGDTPIFGNIHILTGTPRITQFQWSLALRMHFKLITPLGTIRQIKSESPRSCGSRVLLRCCQSFFVCFFFRHGLDQESRRKILPITVHPTHDLVSLGRKQQCAKCFMKVFVDTKNHPKGLEKPCRKRPYREQTALKAEDLWQNIAQGGIERFARKKKWFRLSGTTFWIPIASWKISC